MVISSLLVFSMMGQMVYAFQSTPSSKDQSGMTLSRGKGVHTRTDFNGIGSMSHSATLSPSRARRSVLSTRLQYSSDMDDSSSITSEAVSSSGGRGWLKTLFATDNLESSFMQQTGNEEQENVDAYLEFLDRRYKRLHSNDRVAEDFKSKNPTAFSAMSWLMNGNEESLPSKQQSEDALFVLGVAGLASQKLLQKHHLDATVTETTSTAPPAKGTASQAHSHQLREMGVIEVKAELVTPAYMFVRNLLVPLVRAIHMLHKRKELLLKKFHYKLKSVGVKAIQNVIRPLRAMKKPRSVLNALLNLGGSKHNVMVTLACGYATVLLIQPILTAAVTEAFVCP